MTGLDLLEDDDKIVHQDIMIETDGRKIDTEDKLNVFQKMDPKEYRIFCFKC